MVVLYIKTGYPWKEVKPLLIEKAIKLASGAFPKLFFELYDLSEDDLYELNMKISVTNIFRGEVVDVTGTYKVL